MDFDEFPPSEGFFNSRKMKDDIMVDKLTFIRDLEDKAGYTTAAQKAKLVVETFTGQDLEEVKKECIDKKLFNIKNFMKAKAAEDFKQTYGYEMPVTAPELVERYFEKNKYQINAKGYVSSDPLIPSDNTPQDEIKKTQRDLIIKESDIFGKIDHIRQVNELNISMSDLKQSLNTYVNEKAAKKRKELYAELVARGQGVSPQDKLTNQEWKDFFDYVFPNDPASYPVKKAVFRQWIFNVKKAAQSVEGHNNPLMIILYGEQGAGKSRFLNWFLKPVKEMCFATSLSNYSDEKATSIRENNLVLNIAEMAGATKQDVEQIKSGMDGGLQTTRRLNTHSEEVSYNRAQLIGSSNKDIKEVIKDTTGNRRFIQLELGKDKAYRIDYSQFDVWKFWNDIDTEDQEPLMDPDLADAVSRVQNTQRKLDIYEEWFIHEVIEGEAYIGEKASVTYDDMFNNFKNYVEINKPGMKNMIDLATFKSRMNTVPKTHGKTKKDKTVRTSGKVLRGLEKVARDSGKVVRRYWFE